MVAIDQQLLLRLLGQTEVMAKDVSGKESMNIRSGYLEPLHLIQMELLQRARHAGSDAPLEVSMERALMVSIAGIATGLRNTG